MNHPPLLAFLESAGEHGFQTDDILATVLPLFRQVAAWHGEGLVAPLRDLHALAVEEPGVLRCLGEGIAPRANIAEVEKIQRPIVSALQVVGHSRVTSSEEHGAEFTNLEVIEPGDPITQPAFIVGGHTWEDRVGHHDALTDIFFLGQILASIALGLDFTDRDDVEIFAANRENLFAINSRLHPVIGAVIVEMTELNRHRRAPDLASLIRRLEDYREQTLDLDMGKLPGFADAGLAGRRKLVQAHLRDRLFEITRRNRLLYFRQSQSSLNLTVASVPMVLNLASIRHEQLFVWHDSLAAEIAGGAVNLGRWLRFEDQPYLPSALDKLISEARRDRAEYGFAQLRLVLVFLHWHNLKEAREERISSPLLLLPAELSKKKGVRDRYVLEAPTSEAEVNPVLRYHLQQVYGLHLPERIDLSTTRLEDFHRDLEGQIRKSEPGVTLRLIDKPQIEIIQQRAHQRLAQFERRQKLRTPAQPRSHAQFSYSYDREDFRPLGIQIFREKVLPAALPQRSAAGGIPDPRPLHIVDPATNAGAIETEARTYALRENRAANPYAWDFDLCSITLANFNYRKMSLVRDYGEMLEGDLASESFDRVFSLDPRPFEDDSIPPIPRADQWPVVPGDATQRAAVALARTGRSYIIQGPPGTGKSQTITNLIADYVARGKRVLFVCEKRAAIDVVFHRLRQQGLDELCCLIHDSQTDKKAFVLNLKQTYEKWLSEPDEADAVRARRAAILKRMEEDLAALERFDSAMRSVPEHIAAPVRELIHRLVELRDHLPRLSVTEAELLPSYADWRTHAPVAHRLAATLAEVAGAPSLATHVFRWLGPGIIQAERPLERLLEIVDRGEELVDELSSALYASGLPDEHWDTLEEVAAIVAFAGRLTGLARHGHLEILDPRSAASASVDAAAAELRTHDDAVQSAQAKTVHWKNKLPATDLAAAIAQARADEQSFLRFLKPSWRRLNRTIEERYDFAAHAIRPVISQLLSHLEAEYAAIDARDRARRNFAAQFGADPSELIEAAMALRPAAGEDATIAALRDHLLASPQRNEIVARLQSLAPKLQLLLETLDVISTDFRELPLTRIGENLRELREEAETLPDLLPPLSDLHETPSSFAHALRTFDLTPDALEAAIALASLEKVYRTERWLPRFDGRALAYRAEHIAAAEKEWMAENAAALRAEVRRNFREHVQKASLSATQLDPEGKIFKKSYSAGRRELEHEFGKSMRYKSIRDLAAGNSGRVIRDLKPIWLMSPLSVSDTLPMSPDLFDVVIFDEASQIPIEEAVPALFRAPQVIVVGDEMQLPPTNFFSAARDAEDDTLEFEEAGERVAISLEADSFLNQSARNLPATLLAWHYRSRSESLISFSNAAFYAGQLYTIPDRMLPAPGQSEIIVRSPGDGAANCDALLARPLSFHLMERSPYENRRNAGEAAYIAELVRELLRRNTGLSIGIVAFSEAQQSEIESALDALAAEDTEFGTRLEEEFSRETDDQFCGLFVKNLENVQGDERDIIILSICYGPDASGRMLMNFGPINQRGGEKRLNVIFSRARHHMAVVTSIRHYAITNDYNDGAAALKNFLHYAECTSRGELRLATTVIEGLNPIARKQLALPAEADAVISQLAAALCERGYTVDEHVGQSRFRCDLAVRKPDARVYDVGVIVDTTSFYANPDVAERCVTRPGILRAFGWRVAFILSRDWWHEPEAVLDRIERLLRDDTSPDSEEPAALPVELPEPAPPAPPVAAPAATPAVASNTRHLEFVRGPSAKFWEVTQDGCTLTIRWGRIGTRGQTQTKVFDTETRARTEAEKLAAEKLRRGYKER